MRCFLAIELNEDIKEKLKELSSHFKINGIKLVKMDNLHITVKFLGDIDEEMIEKIKNLDLSIKPVKSDIKHIGVFPNENYIRVIWVGVTNLIPIFKKIDEKLSELGFKKEKDYIPHITIGRVKFIKDKKLLKNKIDKYKHTELGTIEVKNIVLMKSELTREGPIYEVIKKW
ncbi:RNA 2',3'-cyclic phosphodiesterase [Methanothermococcus okinawensis]|uniref:RNA 2',3'-cyclic phosphodiesterase n=1 Tax=Methanothermococcus okinawensis (strain DSM 14208 / JCM 11175 / IH1) TaxID=647113 RepID=F8AK80_METOI|nr:RNA 2',3'-cyclic phosphodiesterase [Methanothermococcus okinawensis]AEH07451.1 2'-5' RNA ligase [Methanothermococcus okinawensis IH1]